MIRRLLVAVAALLSLWALTPPPRAEAHVLVTDTTGKTGAVVHVMPDDDPIAGKSGALFFDVQHSGGQLQKARLYIQDSTGRRASVATERKSTMVTAYYTFPYQGVYDVELHAEGQDKTYIFRYTQRVVRGVSSATTARATHAWADAGLVFGVVSLAGVAIVVYNRRHAIAAYSKM